MIELAVREIPQAETQRGGKKYYCAKNYLFFIEDIPILNPFYGFGNIPHFQNIITDRD